MLFEISTWSIAAISAEVGAALDDESEPLDRLRALIVTHVVTLLSDTDRHATALGELRSLRGSRRKHVVAVRAGYESLVRTLIDNAQKSGSVRQDIEAKYLALALLNLMNYSVIWFQPRRGGAPPRAIAEILADVYLNGVVRLESNALSQDVIR